MEKFITNLALGSGKILKKNFRKNGVASTSKNDSLDLLTATDLAAEKFVIGEIKKKFPNHKIISEESGDNNFKSDCVWVIDPLDGTLNFARGLPLFVTQIAFIEKNKIKFSAVYCPMTEELFFAEAGKGAYCNGKRIFCSKNKDLNSSLLGLTSSMNKKIIKVLEKISKFRGDEKLRTRNFGSIGLLGCDIPSGKIDYCISNGGSLWDYAPIYLLLKESGCEVKNITGDDWQFSDKSMIAGNKDLMKSVLKALK